VKSLNSELEKWAVENVQNVEQWAVQKTKQDTKNAIISNIKWLGFLILIPIGIVMILINIGNSDASTVFTYGFTAVLVLFVGFFLLTGLAFAIPSMLKRLIVRYHEITKGNCHVVIARCAEICPSEEKGWLDVVFLGLDGEIVDTIRMSIPESRVNSEIGKLNCLVYVDKKCRKSYDLLDAQRDLYKVSIG